MTTTLETLFDTSLNPMLDLCLKTFVDLLDWPVAKINRLRAEATEDGYTVFQVFPHNRLEPVVMASFDADGQMVWDFTQAMN